MEGVVQAKDKVKLATGQTIPAPLPEGCDTGTTVQLSVRPEKIAVDELEKGMVSLEGTIEQRVYQGINTQVTVSLGNGARLVALEQQTYRARPEDRWEPGAKVKIGWHPEHCLVLR
jgi:spermidine/putrescine transport system ATP-binding protein